MQLSMLDYAAKLFELAPCKVALHVDSCQKDQLNFLVGCKASLNLVEAFFGKWVPAQIDTLHALRLRQLFKQLVRTIVFDLAVCELDFDNLIAVANGSCNAFRAL